MMSAIKPVRPDFCFLTGWDSALVPMLVMGADGGTHATSGVVPELTRRRIVIVTQEWGGTVSRQVLTLRPDGRYDCERTLDFVPEEVRVPFVDDGP